MSEEDFQRLSEEDYDFSNSVQDDDSKAPFFLQNSQLEEIADSIFNENHQKIILQLFGENRFDELEAFLYKLKESSDQYANMNKEF